MKTITIINKRNGNKTMFKNYQRLYSHIESHQRTRRYNKPNQLIDDWFFACHSYRRVMAFHEFVSIVGKQPKFDVLEMSYGSSIKPTMISVTPNLNIESFLEDWCQRYCESNGYELIEVQNDDGILHVKKT